jgi:hypothetical protein
VYGYILVTIIFVLCWLWNLVQKYRSTTEPQPLLGHDCAGTMVLGALLSLSESMTVMQVLYPARLDYVMPVTVYGGPLVSNVRLVDCLRRSLASFGV